MDFLWNGGRQGWGGEGRGLFNEYIISVLQDKRVMEMMLVMVVEIMNIFNTIDLDT